jgi:hypothetical protein
MRYSRILTVTTPAQDTMLVSLATAKDELDLTTSDKDARITRWIVEASAAITGYVNRKLRLETVVETFRADAYVSEAPGEHFYPRETTYAGTGFSDQPIPGIPLKRYPIVSMASIVEDTVTLDPAADYEVDAENGIVYRLSGTTRIPWTGQVEVFSYSGGYATTDDVEPDIQTACLLMLKHRMAAQGRDPLLQRLSIPGVIDQQFWVGQTTKTAQSGLVPEAEDLVERFRDRHV